MEENFGREALKVASTATTEHCGDTGVRGGLTLLIAGSVESIVSAVCPDVGF